MNNSRDRNENLLSQSGFLRLLALGAGIVLLSACKRELSAIITTA